MLCCLGNRLYRAVYSMCGYIRQLYIVSYVKEFSGHVIWVGVALNDIHMTQYALNMYCAAAVYQCVRT